MFSQNYAGTEKVEYVIPKGASCAPPTTSTYLNINNVKALIHTAGNLWQVPGLNIAQYEIPKNSGIMALFTSALWLGGVDVNGQLKWKGNYKDGKQDGERLEYDDKGQLEYKSNYKEGKKEGESLRYYENGQLYLKSNYKDGKKDGETLVYNENGQFEKTKIYKGGKLIETIKP